MDVVVKLLGNIYKFAKKERNGNKTSCARTHTHTHIYLYI